MRHPRTRRLTDRARRRGVRRSRGRRAGAVRSGGGSHRGVEHRGERRRAGGSGRCACAYGKSKQETVPDISQGVSADRQTVLGNSSRKITMSALAFFRVTLPDEQGVRERQTSSIWKVGKIGTQCCCHAYFRTNIPAQTSWAKQAADKVNIHDANQPEPLDLAPKMLFTEMLENALTNNDGAAYFSDATRNLLTNGHGPRSSTHRQRTPSTGTAFSPSIATRCRRCSATRRRRCRTPGRLHSTASLDATAHLSLILKRKQS